MFKFHIKWLRALIYSSTIAIFVISTMLGCRRDIAKSIGVVEIKDDFKSSNQIIDRLNKYKESPNIRAIIVRISSFGGNVAAAVEIYRTIKRVKKPTVAYIEASAMSGAYLIACACDKIMSNPLAQIGEIHAKIKSPSFPEGLERRGRRFIGLPNSDLTRWQSHDTTVVNFMYKCFIDKIVEGRSGCLSREKILEIAELPIFFLGMEAMEIGLIDTLGFFEDARSLAVSLAGTKGKLRIRE